MVVRYNKEVLIQGKKLRKRLKQLSKHTKGMLVI